MSRLHLWLTILWVVLIVPTVLFWAESILWIGFISIYANVVTHWNIHKTAQLKEEVRG